MLSGREGADCKQPNKQTNKQTKPTVFFFILSCRESSRILLLLTWPLEKKWRLPASKQTQPGVQSNAVAPEPDMSRAGLRHQIWDRLFYLSAGPKFTELVNSEDCSRLGGFPSFSQHICTCKLNFGSVNAINIVSYLAQMFCRWVGHYCCGLYS